MKTGRLAVSASVALLLATTPDPAVAGSVALIPFVGVSKDMRSQTSNRWNTGPSLGAYVLAHTTNYLLLGARVGYHHWSADGAGWFADYYSSTANHTLTSTDGAQSVLELVPTARVEIPPGDGAVKLHLQAGPALLVVMPSDVTIGTTYSGPGVSGSDKRTVSGSTMTGVGPQLGAGLGFGPGVQLTLIYTLYLAQGDLYHHIALNLGFAIEQ